MLKPLKTSFFWVIPLAFLGLFYFFPMERILTLSINRGETGILVPFISAIQSSSIRGVVEFTIWQASLSTLLTLLIGLPGSYFLARFEFRGKAFVRAITGVPFVLPTLVVGAAFNALLGPKGWINAAMMSLLNLSEPPIHFLNTFTAILVAHVFYNTTIVLRMVGDFWSRIDPKLGHAAQSLGANRWQVLRRVTIPLLMPVITAAALLIFIFDFTSFGVILILGGPQYATLEVEIYYQTISLFNLPLASVLSILQLGCTLILTVIYTRFSYRISRPLLLRSPKQTQQRLRTWKSRTLAGLVIGTTLIFLTSPLLALASSSVISFETRRDREAEVTSGLTLDFYRALSQNPQESFFYVPPTTAIGVSLSYATATVILALLVGTPAAWALSRGGDTLINRILDPILMLPLGTSAVTLGLGFIVALAQPPLNFRASPLLIPIAHTLVAFPFVVRSLTPALRSIQPRLRDAAAALGASPRQVLRQIDIPLVGRALIVSATFAFMISMGEFGATSLITRPEYPTIPIVIYRLLSRPGGLNYGQALALATILMVVTLVGMLTIERLRIAEVGEF
jgi:thiamine transport system permease protein